MHTVCSIIKILGSDFFLFFHFAKNFNFSQLRKRGRRRGLRLRPLPHPPPPRPHQGTSVTKLFYVRVRNKLECLPSASLFSLV